MTIASRIMTVVYPIFAVGVGLSFLLGSMKRLLATPTLGYIERMVGLRVMGVGFLIVAVLLVLALVVDHFQLYVGSLAVMAVWMIGYMVLTLLSASHGQASWSAWMWPGFVATAVLASMVSMLARER